MKQIQSQVTQKMKAKFSRQKTELSKSRDPSLPVRKPALHHTLMVLGVVLAASLRCIHLEVPIHLPPVPDFHLRLERSGGILFVASTVRSFSVLSDQATVARGHVSHVANLHTSGETVLTLPVSVSEQVRQQNRGSEADTSHFKDKYPSEYDFQKFTNDYYEYEQGNKNI